MGIIGTISSKASSNGFLTGIDASFANVRGTASAALSNWIGVSGASTYQVGRMMHLFDSSSIVPPGATINSLILVHPLISNLTNNTTSYSVITSHTGADPIGTTDFSSLTLNGATSFGSISLAVLGTAVGTLGISMNASGIAAFVAGGISKYALRNDADFNNIDPGTATNQYTSAIASFQLIVDYNATAIMTTHSKFWGGA